MPRKNLSHFPPFCLGSVPMPAAASSECDSLGMRAKQQTAAAARLTSLRSPTPATSTTRASRLGRLKTLLIQTSNPYPKVSRRVIWWTCRLHIHATQHPSTLCLGRTRRFAPCPSMGVASNSPFSLHWFVRSACLCRAVCRDLSNLCMYMYTCMCTYTYAYISVFFSSFPFFPASFRLLKSHMDV